MKTIQTMSTRANRCKCGQLLAVLLQEGIEIKCKRCKRLETISFEQLKDFIKGIGPQSSDPYLKTADCGLHRTRKKIV